MVVDYPCEPCDGSRGATPGKKWRGHCERSLSWQCRVLGLSRSSWYYQPVPVSPEDVTLMNVMDAQYTKTPFYGSRKMVVFLNHQGYDVNRKRAQRLMREWRGHCEMGVFGVCPGTHTSQSHREYLLYPY